MAPEPVAVETGGDTLTVRLSDARTIAVPLAWYPRLSYATPEELAEFALSPFGIHWPLLDADVSVEALLAGRPSNESAESLKAWRLLTQRRRAQTLAGEGPDPYYPTLPLPDWWDESGA